MSQERFVTRLTTIGEAVDAYNSATSTLETRLLVSARWLRKLRAAPEDVEIEPIEPIERTARGLQAVELSVQSLRKTSDE